MRRHPEAIQAAREKYAAVIDHFIAEQYLFDKQWKALKVRRACSSGFHSLVTCPRKLGIFKFWVS